MAPLCGYIQTARTVAREVATAVLGVLGAPMGVKVFRHRGYVGTRRDLAWEIATAVLRVTDAFVPAEVVSLGAYIRATRHVALQVVPLLLLSYYRSRNEEPREMSHER
eukprot:gnl/TRDRNA2_/TRDRNA2_174937_c12_seq26.p2 gnl/TRDRNA2_/TRDRNA2_174937_c12~~gnl/TRDRNA2_/TRDRNA2_174937_c12_seq26.p2  ORF type:complete len:108 (+),score=7.14 gnl/TRDRNA2_/TRDRNA2_174937_c12_seq26:662-985(+)